LSSPFLTIQAAANIAQPGDVITVHRGIYREHIDPPGGGTSDTNRIIYRAAKGERVEIRGSEVINGWVRYKGNTWKVSIPNSFFGPYNPYKEIISGDWFFPGEREHHTGEVYLNDKSLYEKDHLVIDKDFFGIERKKYPKAGPFESIKQGADKIRIW